MQAVHPNPHREGGDAYHYWRRVQGEGRHLEDHQPLSRQHTIIKDRILGNVDPAPKVFLTNQNPDPRAWKEDESVIADLDPDGHEGIIEIQV